MKFKIGDTVIGTFSNNIVIISKIIGFNHLLTQDKYTITDIFSTDIYSFSPKLELDTTYFECQYVLYEDFLNAIKT